MRAGLASLDEDVLHLVPLPLGFAVGADAVLDELEALLVLPDSEQLLRSLLVRREPHHLAHLDGWMDGRALSSHPVWVFRGV